MLSIATKAPVDKKKVTSLSQTTDSSGMHTGGNFEGGRLFRKFIVYIIVIIPSFKVSI